MDFLLKALLVALIILAVGWMVVEFLATIDISRDPPSTNASGVETAIGNPAVVITSFAVDDKGKLRGRVRVEGEDWRAVYVGDQPTPPAKGDSVSVVDVDTGRLEVTVE